MGTQPGRGAPVTTDAGAAGGGPTDARRPRRPGRTAGAPWLGRVDWTVWVAVVCGLLFVALTVLVATGATQSLDSRIILHYRPTDEWWGDLQKEYSPWMSRFNPRHSYVLLAGTALVMTLWRRSLWPLVFAGTLAVVSGGLTVVVKFAVDRPDPHDFVTASGGSYPSGHMVALLVCLGGCLLLVFRRVRWWYWIPSVLAAGLLTAALVVAAAHWPSDILGGALLAAALVAAASRSGLRRRTHP